MNRLLVILCGYLLVSNTCLSQSKLEIDIVEIRNDTGNIMLQVFDENEKVIIQEMSPVKNKKCSFSILTLRHGRYAVRYYHDENINGKMEINIVGKPTEGYGFSNNVIGKFGPPPFEQWLFEFKGDKKIVLKPTY